MADPPLALLLDETPENNGPEDPGTPRKLDKITRNLDRDLQEVDNARSDSAQLRKPEAQAFAQDDDDAQSFVSYESVVDEHRATPVYFTCRTQRSISMVRQSQLSCTVCRQTAASYFSTLPPQELGCDERLSDDDAEPAQPSQTLALVSSQAASQPAPSQPAPAPSQSSQPASSQLDASAFIRRPHYDSGTDYFRHANHTLRLLRTEALSRRAMERNAPAPAPADEPTDSELSQNAEQAGAAMAEPPIQVAAGVAPEQVPGVQLSLVHLCERVCPRLGLLRRSCRHSTYGPSTCPTRWHCSCSTWRLCMTFWHACCFASARSVWQYLPSRMTPLQLSSQYPGRPMLGGVTDLQRGFLVDWMLGFTMESKMGSEIFVLAAQILDRLGHINPRTAAHCFADCCACSRSPWRTCSWLRACRCCWRTRRRVLAPGCNAATRSCGVVAMLG